MTTRFIKALLVLALGGLGLVAVSCGGRRRVVGAVGRHAEHPRHGRRCRQPRPRLLVLPARTTQQLGEHHAAAAVRLEARRDQAHPRPGRGPAGGLERRQDGDGQDQAEHQVQRTSPDPHGQVSRRQVRARALLPAAGRQRLRKRLLRRHRGREGLPGQEGRRDLGHRDARRPDARDQLDEAVRHHRRRQRARHALHRSRAEGLRAEVRRGQAVDVRPAPGLHRPVHDRERRQGQDHGLRARARGWSWSGTRAGTSRPTSSRRTSTGSSRRAAATPRSRPGRRSPDRAT